MQPNLPYLRGMSVYWDYSKKKKARRTSSYFKTEVPSRRAWAIWNWATEVAGGCMPTHFPACASTSACAQFARVAAVHACCLYKRSCPGAFTCPPLARNHPLPVCKTGKVGNSCFKAPIGWRIVLPNSNPTHLVWKQLTKSTLDWFFFLVSASAMINLCERGNGDLQLFLATSCSRIPISIVYPWK